MSTEHVILILHLLLVFEIQRSQSRGYFDGEYCDTEVFRAECPDGEIIIMDHAQYGRMQLGRCVEEDIGGYIGCFRDVLHVTDRRCSGRRVCEIRIPDAEFESLRPCLKELKTYLNASYQCVTVEEATHQEDIHCGRSPQPSTSTHGANVGHVVTLPTGYIASIVTSEALTYCEGGVEHVRDYPWVIAGQRGQRVNLTLYDFTPSANPATLDVNINHKNINNNNNNSNNNSNNNKNINNNYDVYDNHYNSKNSDILIAENTQIENNRKIMHNNDNQNADKHSNNNIKNNANNKSNNPSELLSRPITAFCRHYAVISDSGLGTFHTGNTVMDEMLPICGTTERIRHVFTSVGHVVKLRVMAAARQKWRFVIRYEVFGCPDLEEEDLPEGAWFSRVERSTSTMDQSFGDLTQGNALVGCHETRLTWPLTCVDGSWVGAFGNCSFTTTATTEIPSSSLSTNSSLRDPASAWRNYIVAMTTLSPPPHRRLAHAASGIPRSFNPRGTTPARPQDYDDLSTTVAVTSVMMSIVFVLTLILLLVVIIKYRRRPDRTTIRRADDVIDIKLYPSVHTVYPSVTELHPIAAGSAGNITASSSDNFKMAAIDALDEYTQQSSQTAHEYRRSRTPAHEYALSCNSAHEYKRTSSELSQHKTYSPYNHARSPAIDKSNTSTGAAQEYSKTCSPMHGFKHAYNNLTQDCLLQTWNESQDYQISTSSNQKLERQTVNICQQSENKAQETLPMASIVQEPLDFAPESLGGSVAEGYIRCDSRSQVVRDQRVRQQSHLVNVNGIDYEHVWSAPAASSCGRKRNKTPGENAVLFCMGDDDTETRQSRRVDRETGAELRDVTPTGVEHATPRGEEHALPRGVEQTSPRGGAVKQVPPLGFSYYDGGAIGMRGRRRLFHVGVTRTAGCPAGRLGNMRVPLTSNGRNVSESDGHLMQSTIY